MNDNNTLGAAQGPSQLIVDKQYAGARVDNHTGLDAVQQSCALY